MTQAQPTFSVCIPNYNYGHFIGETIQSVLDQTYPLFEVIIADNASTDNSVEVIRSFNDDRIRLVENRYNIGFAPNLQRATMYAQNDFINLLSSDDQMKPDALETYVEIIREMSDQAERLVLYSDVDTFDNDGHVTGAVRKAPDGFYIHTIPFSQNGDQPAPIVDAPSYSVYRGLDVLADSLRRLKTFAPFLSTVYSRALWEAVEGYNSVRTIGPDKFFNYKLLAQDPVVVHVPRTLFRYRAHISPNRASQDSNLKQPIDDYLYTIEYKDDYLKTLGLSRRDLIRAFLDRVCLRSGLSHLGRRNYAQAFRLLMFAFASYPGETLRLSKTYALLFLLLLGPLSSRWLAPTLYGMRARANAAASDITDV
ncbi:MAG: glycosyltransferase [Chloroflexi bacterium]|nr:glycosyltransferase [Chloroflexota bacterium]